MSRFAPCRRPLNYIIPIPAGAPAGIAGASSLILATTDSVVNNVEATDVAFCNALLVTLAGSMKSALSGKWQLAHTVPVPRSISPILQRKSQK